MKTMVKVLIGIIAALMITGCEKDWEATEWGTMETGERLQKSGISERQAKVIADFTVICYPMAYENVNNAWVELGDNGTATQERELTFKYMAQACEKTRASIVNTVRNIRDESSLKKFVVDATIAELINEFGEDIAGQFWGGR